MKLAVRRDQTRSCGQGEGGKDSGDELVRALSEGHETGLIVEQRGHGLSVPLRLHLGEVPFSIHMQGRVEPCPLLCLEGDVGPRLMGVTREQKALRDAKVCIVPGESGCVDQVGLGFDWWRPVSREVRFITTPATRVSSCGTGY